MYMGGDIIPGCTTTWNKTTKDDLPLPWLVSEEYKMVTCTSQANWISPPTAKNWVALEVCETKVETNSKFK